ncbi:amino acid biosynthesis protein [Agrilactobacillus fermenti]|uniref:amino acid biosynthesis protein n=1 Tax=Agrilactobacillus fermenti TaxID=2586909 RepID=UPI001E4BBBC3|nr:amino acid biosynthesis protein [Agrilactobacillus fermenti]MCD2257351.1 amino acid biosynthesis protein [Agrilactobacillus fermenti]
MSLSQAPATSRSMLIHTLGPTTTDSCLAIQTYLAQQHVTAQIQLHPNYETILTHLTDYKSEYLWIPAAFQSQVLHETWGDIHYCQLDHLDLQTSFTNQLDQLLLLENTLVTNQIAFTHAATAKLLLQQLPDAVIKTSPSKYQAYQIFLNNPVRYVLTNARIITLRATDQILKVWQPKMVWCLYQII